MSLGPAEILVIFLIALLVFGPNRLPEIGRQVGRGVRELRKFQATLKSDLDDVFDDTPSRSDPPPELPPLASSPPPVASNESPPASEVTSTPDVVSTPDVLEVNPPPPPPPDPT